MATKQEFVDFIVGQIEGIGEIIAKPMFGEYALYCDGKMFGLVCDNQFFLKPTLSGRTFIGTPIEAPPYPGAKPCFLIEAQLEDKDWLSALVLISLPELPFPKPRKKKE